MGETKVYFRDVAYLRQVQLPGLSISELVK